MNNKLYIGNLSYDTNEAALREVFTGAGDIKAVTIPLDRMNNEPRGFAFVEMNTPEEARKAIQMFDGREIDGRKVQVSEARPAERRPSGFGQKSTARRY